MLGNLTMDEVAGVLDGLGEALDPTVRSAALALSESVQQLRADVVALVRRSDAVQGAGPVPVG